VTLFPANQSRSIYEAAVRGEHAALTWADGAGIDPTEAGVEQRNANTQELHNALDSVCNAATGTS
jgi:hypothetical protein